MKSREAWVEEQERALAGMIRLGRSCQISGVVEVGVGIKETGRDLTETSPSSLRRGEAPRVGVPRR